MNEYYMPYKALVIKDNLHKAENPLSAIESHKDLFTVLGIYTEYDVAISYIYSKDIDLVFFIIGQDENSMCMSILSSLQNLSFKVVVVAPDERYCFQAFHYGALHYIKGNITPWDIQTILQRMNISIPFENGNKIQQTFHSLVKNKIHIISKDAIHVCHLENIEFAEAKGSYTEIHCTDKNSIIQSKNLKHFELSVMDSGLFLKVHRSFIINKNEIKIIYKQSENRIEMRSGKIVHTSLTDKELIDLL